MELYKKYRPKTLEDIIGQPEAVSVLKRLLKTTNVPNSILFSGPSGCGKTTLARILKKELGCHNSCYLELNAASSRGIDTIRQIQDRINLAPIAGKCRMYVIDEAHQLTKDAQNALLKILEDTPKTAYLILCTTDPTKLIKTIITRCTEIKVKGFPESKLSELVAKVIQKELKKEDLLPDEVIERIAEVSEGSARKALVILNQIIGLDSVDEMLEAIQASDARRDAIEIARLLINPKSAWKEVASLIKKVEDEPESIRRLVLSYASAVCLSGGPLKNRAHLVLEVFRDHWYDEGKAGLVRSCYDVIHSK